MGQPQRLPDLQPPRYPDGAERRQTIGRGLRLCVNQDGERVRGFEVNTLTVIATEPFEDFAANLQKEIEADTGSGSALLNCTSWPLSLSSMPRAFLLRWEWNAPRSFGTT